MKINKIDITAVVIIFVGLIGVYEVWFGTETIPPFVIIILSAILTGGYGLIRFTQFKDRPGLNQKGSVRLIGILLIILMLWGLYSKSQETDFILIISLLGALGINAASLINESRS